MPEPKHIGIYITVYFVAFFIAGVYYLVVANSWDNKWNNSVLKNADVYTKTSCSTTNGHTSCSNTYYVEEIFDKFANTTHTCTVRRLTPYSFKGDANAFVGRTILGTERTIYQTTYSAGTCFDDKIRYQYNIYGGVFLGLSMIPVVVLLFCLGCWLLEKFQKWLSEQSFSVSRLSTGTEMKSYTGGSGMTISETMV